MIRESRPFLEAIRQVSLEVGRENSLFIHVTLVQYLKGSNGDKSKPTQHSVKELRALGINPNIIVTRSDKAVEESIKQKISLFCNVKQDCVIENITIQNLYEAPLMLERQGFSEIVCRELEMDSGNAGFENDVKVDIKWIEAEDLEMGNDENLDAGVADTQDQRIERVLSHLDGILVPGGFGDRGIEGKILACKHARENDIPYFGICLGMQIAAIEYARNVLGLKAANSKEFEKSGMIFSGTSPDERLVESIEIHLNRFFIGVQYHPEFKSRPNKSHPIFREFIRASKK